MLPLSQKNLYIKLNHSLIKDAVIIRVEVFEAISELFQIDVFLQTDKELDIEKVIDTSATISIELENEKKTYFSGIIEKASFENMQSSISTKTDNILYLKISPTLNRTKYTNKYRTFQEMTTKEIIESVLKENGITNVKIGLSSAGKTKRTFCVQYGESDFHFISRLMEEEGIFYSFESDDGKDVLIISDSSVSSKKFQTELKIRKQGTDATLTSDSAYNVSFSSEVGVRQIDSYSYSISKAEVIKGSSSDTKEKYKIGNKEIFDSVFLEKASGDQVSKSALECDNSSLKTISGHSYCPYVYAGGICQISGSRTKKHNGEFFIISVKHSINQIPEDPHTPVYYNSFVGIPIDISFRPTNKHKKNRIFSCQTAIVTGISGEEIFCDENACVKVKFHWDSRTKKDEKSSCWIRVAQTWAGGSFGALVIPRVGMEVLVAFVNGDPDQPMITGCVYNGVNKPPANYPKEKNTVSSFYTKSYKEKGYNEIRFDDKAQEEEIFVHAQKDLNYIAENSVSGTLNEGSRKITLESKKDPVENSLLIKKGDNKITIEEGNYTLVLDKGNQSITLKEGNQTVKLSKGDILIDVNGNISIKATQNIKIEADGTIDILSKKAMSFDSKDNISISATKNFKLDCTSCNQTSKQAFSISCLKYELKANASMNISCSTAKLMAKITLDISCNAAANIKSAAIMNISGTAALVLKGGIIKLN
jgi:type VI secretion system secreted protein VgrG